MYNNLLTDLQNEISTIGFDKLKEIHFGAECTSGSESGENDVLDDRYYKNQPPAQRYEFIKDHIVKVNQKSRIQQHRKPYNHNKGIGRRGKPRHNWKHQRSGPNAAQALQRDTTVSSRFHALPAPISKEGFSNSSLNNHIPNWQTYPCTSQKVLESAISSTPQRMFPIHSQVFTRRDFITETRVFPDVASKNTFQSSTAALSSNITDPSSNAVRLVPHNYEKPPGIHNHCTMSSKKNDSQTNNGHTIIGYSSQREICDSRGLTRIEAVQNSAPDNPGKLVTMEGSPLARQFNKPSSVGQQILSADKILSTYLQNDLGSGTVPQSNVNTQRLPLSEQCPRSNGDHPISKRFSDDFPDLYFDQEQQKWVNNWLTTSNLFRTTNAVTLASDITSTIKPHNLVGKKSGSKVILAQPTCSTFADKCEGGSSSMVRQKSKASKNVGGNIHKNTSPAHPTSTPDAFLEYIESRLAQNQPKARTFQSDNSKSTKSVMHDHLKNSSKNVAEHSRIQNDSPATFAHKASPKHEGAIVLDKTVSKSTAQVRDCSRNSAQTIEECFRVQNDSLPKFASRASPKNVGTIVHDKAVSKSTTQVGDRSRNSAQTIEECYRVQNDSLPKFNPKASPKNVGTIVHDKSVSRSSAQVRDSFRNSAQTIEECSRVQNDSLPKFVPEAVLKEVRTIVHNEAGSATGTEASKNRCEEPAKTPPWNNESALTGIISWFCRIICCARNTNTLYETF